MFLCMLSVKTASCYNSLPNMVQYNIVTGGIFTGKKIKLLYADGGMLSIYRLATCLHLHVCQVLLLQARRNTSQLADSRQVPLKVARVWWYTADLADHPVWLAAHTYCPSPLSICPLVGSRVAGKPHCWGQESVTVAVVSLVWCFSSLMVHGRTILQYNADKIWVLKCFRF